MGITDGTVICTLCGQSLTGCLLCGQAPTVDISAKIAQQEAAKREAERELWEQERSIRTAADARRGL